MQPIRMHLPHTQIFFFHFFDAFFEATLNFEHFEKKVTPIA